MTVAGCDVGSLTSKAVIMKDGKIAGFAVIKSKSNPVESAEEAMALALGAAGLSMKDIVRCVGTGYGRDRIPFADKAVTEIACHGRGARWLVPTARTVIDIGGQDCKVMKLDGEGRPLKFAANDKCASGTGRFLEVMADLLGLKLDELGELSARSASPVTLASACTVWAQADVIRYVNEKRPIEDIVAGINGAMAGRIALLVHGIGLEKELCMTGGVAKNSGVVSALEKSLGVRIKRIHRSDPQIAGAIGAAIIAGEKAEGGGA